MRVFARSTGRAPAVVGFLLLSLIVHLAVLRGASLATWLATSPPRAPAVSVQLIVPPVAASPPTAPTVAAPKAVERSRAKPSPRPKARPARRATPKPARPVPDAAPLAPEAAPLAATASPAVRYDTFGSPLDAEAPQADADGAPETVEASTEAPAPAAQPPTQDAARPEVDAPAQAIAAQPAQPAEPPVAVVPQAGTVRYLVHYGDAAEGYVVATLEQTFEIGPDRYRLHSEGRARGLTSLFYRGTLVQDSVGTVSAAGLSPSSYREQRGDRPARTVSIDAERREATFGSGARHEAPPGVQDRLSAVVQLALLRQSRPALFERGASIVLPMLGHSRVDRATWRVNGEEQVATEAGTVTALRLSRASLDPDDPAIDLWLALDSSIVPVRMRITDRGGRALDQVIASQ